MQSNVGITFIHMGIIVMKKMPIQPMMKPSTVGL